MTDANLPPLPQAKHFYYSPSDTRSVRKPLDLFTTEQMHAYAMAALAATTREPLSRLGFEAVINPNIPAGVIRFYQDGKLVGEIKNIKVPS